MLKYHKALAIGADHVIAVQQSGELEPLLALLEGPCGAVQRVAAASEARDRTPSERKQYREARLRAHLEGGHLLALGVDRPADARLDPRRAHRRRRPPPTITTGTLVGLLDRAGFCLALGVMVSAHHDRVEIYTALRDPSTVARIQLGRLRLGAGCEELR